MVILLGQHLTCKTNSGPFPNKPCVFPFKILHDGSAVVYHECIILAGHTKPSCPIDVDQDGYSNVWGYCSPGCPGVPAGMSSVTLIWLSFYIDIISNVLIFCQIRPLWFHQTIIGATSF